MNRLFLIVILAAGPAAGMPLPFERDGRWGYESSGGGPVIAPRFIMAAPFNGHGIAPVLDSAGWAFIDTTGKTVVRPLVVDNGPDYFSEGMARFARDGKVGFFDESGREVIPPAFDFARPFHEDLAAVCAGCARRKEGEYTRVTGGTWGYIDRNGKTVIPLSFTAARDFKNGRAEVKSGKWWQCIGPDGGKTECPPEESADPAQDQAAQTAVPSGVPEQRIEGNPMFEEAYIRECRLVFRDCLLPVLAEAGKHEAGAEPDSVLTEKCRGCYRRYYQSMKGNTNITFKDLDELLQWSAGRKKQDFTAPAAAAAPSLGRELKEVLFR